MTELIQKFKYNLSFFNKTLLNFKLKKNYKFLTIETYKNYFFNLNKWPIDKAPKISASSYLVGLGLIFLFHVYTMNNWEKVIYFSFSFFTLDCYLINIFIIFLTLLLVSYEKNYRIFFVMLLFPLFFFLFYYFSHDLLVIVTNKMLVKYTTVISFKFAISWEFYLFLFFLFGWIFKVSQKYSVESLTKSELFLYKSLIPTIYIFETVTLFYILIWRYMNTTLAGYATVMYGHYYKNQEITNFLITKLAFFNSSILFVFLLLLLLKFQRTSEFFIIFFIFILYSIFFLVKEGFEIWIFTHQTLPLNLLKFTYFKYLKFLLFFNYFHAYVVILFSLVLFIKSFQKDNTILNSYEFIFVIIKNLYFIMWFVFFTFFSVYVITNLDFQYPVWTKMFFKMPVKYLLEFKNYKSFHIFELQTIPFFR